MNVSSLFAFTERPAPTEPQWWTADDLPETGEGLALSLDNTVDVTALAATLPRLAIIRLHFPAFADGRAYSQARLLRRLGFQGHLRAAGKAVVLDQALELRAAGFDSAELREDQTAAAWAAWLDQQPSAGLFSADRSVPFGARRPS